MGEISRFMGMKIIMFYNEHGDPHIHIYRQKYLIKIDLNGNVIKGELPQSHLAPLREWIKMNKAKILKNWDNLRNEKPIERIDPWSRK